jgi:hypothetical protein
MNVNTCPSCGKPLQKAGAVCRRCRGQVRRRPASLQALLDRTAQFPSDLQTAQDAIEEYLRQWPNGAEARDVHIANQCMRLFFTLAQLAQGKFKEGAYAEAAGLADMCAEGLPPLLANGLPTAARLKDVAKRKGVADTITFLNQASAFVLQTLYDLADKEQQALLVNGKLRCQVDGVTWEQARRDAEVHWDSFQKGELEAALKGFTYLKGLNPKEAFFRLALGSILLGQGKRLPALQESLYGHSLAPSNADLTVLALRCVCGFALFPAALEIVRHYEKTHPQERDQRISTWGVLARAVTAALAARMSNCTPEDFSAEATDVIDELEVPPRPWLTVAPPSAQSEDVLSSARVFISYRHSGGLDFAEHLERTLKGAYPSMRVFRDETWIKPGHDYVNQLRDEIDTTDVVLALVDQQWAKRFRDPGDVLRREIARAFEHNRKIIPLLLDQAEMPKESDLPTELLAFARLDGIRITANAFSQDVALLQVELSRVLTEKRQEEKAVSREIERVLALKEHDPEAAKRIIERWADAFPKYVPGKSLQGEGVPTENVPLAGQWECTATLPRAQLKLTFLAEDTDQRPFSGEWCITPLGFMSFVKVQREEIRGTWMPVEDVEQNLLLGIFLDGLKSGQPFKFTIPIHRRLGNELVGTDAQGITYSSRNARPAPRRL